MTQRHLFVVISTFVLLLSLSACGSTGPFASPVSSPLPTSTPLRRTSLLKFQGSSMEPNFHDEQLIVVEEISVSELQRGDVIVFARNDEPWLKRLVGLPGELVEIRAGEVFINGKALDEPYIQRPASNDFPALTLKQADTLPLATIETLAAIRAAEGQFRVRAFTGACGRNPLYRPS